ncbi:hypothetical protein [Mesobacillus jeotgali]|uniref:Uncharacterized protein n=1 Tax=Mesobacillus jeotgali TaxID=129985 RepID=A0ABY9VIH1_9BACI|nr:hypothetical protein [Mesobacillus jeotgali]WNF22611.1 hypothetical protein RH061_21050 [Mesobacillus jeotgali]
MIYINEVPVAGDLNLELLKREIKAYLHKEKLVLIDQSGNILSENKVNSLLESSIEKDQLFLQGVKTNLLLRDFKDELILYIKKVEDYIENVRDTEDFSTVKDSFVQIIESVLEFTSVSDFLQKDLIGQDTVKELAQKAFAQAESGNDVYILDLIEYELLPLLNHFSEGIQEEM